MKRYHLYHPTFGWCVINTYATTTRRWRPVDSDAATFFKTPQELGISTYRKLFERFRRRRYFSNGQWHDGEDLQIVELPNDLQSHNHNDSTPPSS